MVGPLKYVREPIKSIHFLYDSEWTHTMRVDKYYYNRFRKKMRSSRRFLPIPTIITDERNRCYKELKLYNLI